MAMPVQKRRVLPRVPVRRHPCLQLITEPESLDLLLRSERDALLRDLDLAPPPIVVVPHLQDPTAARLLGQVRRLLKSAKTPERPG